MTGLSCPFSDAELEWVFRGVSSFRALRVISEHYDLPFDAVRQEMDRQPDEAWALLDSPDGWSALGERFAFALQGFVAVPALHPTIN